MYRKLFVVLTAIAALALPGLAQDSKLNGTWKLKRQEQLRPVPAPDQRNRHAHRQGQRLQAGEHQRYLPRRAEGHALVHDSMARK